MIRCEDGVPAPRLGAALHLILAEIAARADTAEAERLARHRRSTSEAARARVDTAIDYADELDPPGASRRCPRIRRCATPT